MGIKLGETPRKSGRPEWLMGPPSSGKPNAETVSVVGHPLERLNLTKADYPEGVWGVIMGEGYDWRAVENGYRSGDPQYIKIYNDAKALYDSLPD